MSLGVDYKVLSSLVMVNGAWVTLVVLRAARLSLMSNCGDPAGHSGGSGGGWRWWEGVIVLGMLVAGYDCLCVCGL